MLAKDFTILITTKNRVEDLKVTLNKIEPLIKSGVTCIVYDDGSTDDTANYIQTNFPEVTLLKNKTSKGYLYNRNMMLNAVQTKYAISLDDDAYFLTQDVLQNIDVHFKQNLKCGLIAFRIFWDTKPPFSTITKIKSHIVNGFVGCGHVWNMEAWKSIPNYPEWFEFYGEEQFAAYQLFKNKWEIHYLPSVLVQHCVDMQARSKHKDYLQRQRRSLRSGWYLYFMCYPKRLMFKKFTSSLWSQLKRKTFKGNVMATKAIILALKDLIINSPKIVKGNYRLHYQEYKGFSKLPNVTIYWKPNE